MSKKRKILSIMLCMAVALAVGIPQFTTGAAEADGTAEVTAQTAVKSETVTQEEAMTEGKTTKALASNAVKETVKDTEQATEAEGTEQETTEQSETVSTENTEQTTQDTEKQSESSLSTEKAAESTQKAEVKAPVTNNTNRIAQKQAEAKAKEQAVAKANPAVEEPSYDDKTDWEYAPAWVGGDQKYIRGNLLAAVEARELSIGTKAYVEEIKESINTQGDVKINEDADNMAEALAVYAVLTEQTDGFPYGISIDNENNAKLLQSIYWNMTRITGAANGDGNVLTVKRLGIDDVVETLGLSNEQAEAAKALLTDDARADVEVILTGSILTKLTDEELSVIEARLPKELSAERKAVLMAGLSLEGKIGYFWGGKSFNTGWDERWGEMRTVVGSKQDGKVKPLGLDCSGFVSWAFINASGDQDALNYIGNGTANQYRSSKPIAWNEVQPGDLLFYKNPSAGGVNHVGIVLTVNEDGTPKEVIHCASSKNGVVVTGPRGFKFARRPYIYGE